MGAESKVFTILFLAILGIIFLLSLAIFSIACFFIGAFFPDHFYLIINSANLICLILINLFVSLTLSSCLVDFLSIDSISKLNNFFGNYNLRVLRQNNETRQVSPRSVSQQNNNNGMNQSRPFREVKHSDVKVEIKDDNNTAELNFLVEQIEAKHKDDQKKKEEKYKDDQKKKEEKYKDDQKKKEENNTNNINNVII